MFKQLSSVSILSFLLAACASTTPPSLVDARAAYQRAARGPAAQVNPAQLHVAETSLALAERTYEDEGASENARDRAYVATRKSELAEVQAAIALAERNTALAARRVQAAKAQDQLTTERDLDTTRAQLAGQTRVVANQTVQLASEKQRREAADQRAAQALATLTSIASVKQEARGTVITLSGAVIFASGQAMLLPAAQSKLDQVAAALVEGESQGKILIEGHTDSRGSDELNRDLSTRRAEAVRSYLASKGVAADRMQSQGVGPSRPVADNETAEGRANNRRVEIVVQPG